MNFSNVLPNLKMTLFIAFNLVSKFSSCPVAATDIAGAGLILTIPGAEEIAVAVAVEGGGKSDKNIAVSCDYRNRCLIGRNVCAVMSLIS